MNPSTFRRLKAIAAIVCSLAARRAIQASAEGPERAGADGCAGDNQPGRIGTPAFGPPPRRDPGDSLTAGLGLAAGRCTRAASAALDAEHPRDRECRRFGGRPLTG